MIQFKFFPFRSLTRRVVITTKSGDLLLLLAKWHLEHFSAVSSELMYGNLDHFFFHLFTLRFHVQLHTKNLSSKWNGKKNDRIITSFVKSCLCAGTLLSMSLSSDPTRNDLLKTDSSQIRPTFNPPERGPTRKDVLKLE